MEHLSIVQITILGIIIFLNIRTYSLYYTDKKRAVQKKQNRISEKKLILSAFLLGGIGALLGMTTIRHKTKHFKFTLLVPIAAALTAYVILLTLQ